MRRKAAMARRKSRVDEVTTKQQYSLEVTIQDGNIKVECPEIDWSWIEVDCGWNRGEAVKFALSQIAAKLAAIVDEARDEEQAEHEKMSYSEFISEYEGRETEA